MIGDFVWTAWDYIGEVGVGRWEVSEEPRPAGAGYPWLLAYCGDFDFLGYKRPQSYYRDVVWGNAKGPKLFCLPPELTGKPIARLSWGWLPVQRNYTFPSTENQEVEIHIYADAEEVELFQNGISMGKQPCTEKEKFEAVFTIPYRPGTLEAAAYHGGKEIGRDTLRTALFSGETCPLFEGRAMAVIRAVPGGGAIPVRAVLENGAQGEATIQCPEGEPTAERSIHDVMSLR